MPPVPRERRQVPVPGRVSDAGEHDEGHERRAERAPAAPSAVPTTATIPTRSPRRRWATTVATHESGTTVRSRRASSRHRPSDRVIARSRSGHVRPRSAGRVHRRRSVHSSRSGPLCCGHRPGVSIQCCRLPEARPNAGARRRRAPGAFPEDRAPGGPCRPLASASPLSVRGTGADARDPIPDRTSVSGGHRDRVGVLIEGGSIDAGASASPTARGCATSHLVSKRFDRSRPVRSGRERIRVPSSTDQIPGTTNEG